VSAATDWDFDTFLEDLEEDAAQQLKDVAALIYAGMDQARSELNMPWTAVSHKGMIALSQQLAIFTKDWTMFEGLLAGTWMAGSSRSQILQSSEEG